MPIDAAIPSASSDYYLNKAGFPQYSLRQALKTVGRELKQGGDELIPIVSEL